MIKFILSFSILTCFSFPAISQNLLKERIWKVTGRKRSIYLEKGIFHTKKSQVNSKIIAVRHSSNPSRSYERIVFDFNTKMAPQIYGYIESDARKLYIDFKKTSLKRNIASFGSTKYVKSLNFYPINKEALSVEVKFKQKVSVDIFYLNKPGRLVIDVKE